MTEWRDIPGAPGYQASDSGRIRSLSREVDDARGHKVKCRGQELTPIVLRTGYSTVNLHVGAQQLTKRIHQLVTLTFLGERPDGLEVRHLNGHRSDNRLANLAYGTHEENMADQRRHGTHRNTVKTACPSGHPYSTENTYWSESGGRQCRICKDRNRAASAARRKAAA